MGQANCISTTPWDELELHDPVQLGHSLVLLLPIAIQANYLKVDLVNHQDVGGCFSLGLLVVFQLQVAVDVIDLAKTVLVVFKLLTLNLVVGLLNFVLLKGLAGFDVADIAVHPSSDAALKLIGGDLVNFSRTLGGVEVGGRKGQDHPVDWQELHAWTLLLLIKPQLEIL